MKSDQRDENRREEKNTDKIMMVIVRRGVADALVGNDRVPSHSKAEGGREVDEMADARGSQQTCRE